MEASFFKFAFIITYGTCHVWRLSPGDYRYRARAKGGMAVAHDARENC